MPQIKPDVAASELACAVFNECISELKTGTDFEKQDVLEFVKYSSQFPLFCAWANLEEDYARSKILAMDTKTFQGFLDFNGGGN